MKTILLILVSFTLFAASLPAELPEVVVTTEMLERPLGEWQLNGVTFLVLLMFVGRVFKYMKANGGLKSILRGLWHGGVKGENAPDSLPGPKG